VLAGTVVVIGVAYAALLGFAFIAGADNIDTVRKLTFVMLILVIVCWAFLLLLSSGSFRAVDEEEVGSARPREETRLATSVPARPAPGETEDEMDWMSPT